MQFHVTFTATDGKKTVEKTIAGSCWEHGDSVATGRARATSWCERNSLALVAVRCVKRIDRTGRSRATALLA